MPHLTLEWVMQTRPTATHLQLDNDQDTAIMQQEPVTLLPQLLTVLVNHAQDKAEELRAGVAGGHADKHKHVYTGIAGVALALYKLHLADPGASAPSSTRSLHDIAADLAQAALSGVPIASLLTHETHPRDPHHVGLLDSTLGTAAAATRILTHAGHVEQANQLKDLVADQATTHGFSTHTSSEVLYGRAGLLDALMLTDAEPELLAEVAEAIIEDGKRTAQRLGVDKAGCPLMWTWHDTVYLGGAHGVAGILMHLWTLPVGVIRAYIPDMIKTMAYVAEFDGYPYKLDVDDAEAGMVTPVYGTRGDEDAEVVVQFCHGVTGLGLMWLRAWRAVGGAVGAASVNVEPEVAGEWLAKAKACGEVVWQRGIVRKHLGLCHGLSGNAYLFVQLWSATGDLVWYRRALAFAAIGAHWHGGRCDHPYSVWEGVGGYLWLLADLIIVNRFIQQTEQQPQRVQRPWVDFPSLSAANLDVAKNWAEIRRRTRSTNTAVVSAGSAEESSYR
ncbi:hypothetical protein BCR44DRAFT_189034 [Catenaria anguillulae PL171]|uniref:Lanthionine synthetase C-like protein n=1 Tax=Catenaria anguillulae PL171 TaxID=765915 RepID=A0A1Y2HIJ3_9FUNG|nr:hypothetical protein BCR44DRAFT_189034 [Catenaria anguillulae PL171]